MLTIIQAQTAEQIEQFQQLMAEYIAWDQQMSRDLGLDVNKLMSVHYNAPLSQLAADCAPPAGRMLLASDDGAVGGCVGLRALAPDIGEVKRLYVRPTMRGKGAGKALLDTLIAEARHIGYTTLRLETASFMKDAHRLYYALGFQDIAPYADVPDDFKYVEMFMELKLT